MKNLKCTYGFMVFMVGCFLINTPLQSIHGQSNEKNKVRLKANYIKIMDSLSYLDIVASARIDKQNKFVPNITVDVYDEVADKNLGSITTNANGKAKYLLGSLDNLLADSTNTYKLKVVFNGNDAFTKANRTISFKDAAITVTSFKKDSTNYIKAILKETITDSLISEENLKVQVQRLLRPLPIGEEFNYTDTDGSILVPVEPDIPGIDGKLNIEVVLDDHDTYGTVKAIETTTFGVPIVVENTFHERHMWSTRDKTPWFMLIFINLIIVSIWGIIIYLFINLFKIKKS